MITDFMTKRLSAIEKEINNWRRKRIRAEMKVFKLNQKRAKLTKKQKEAKKRMDPYRPKRRRR